MASNTPEGKVKKEIKDYLDSLGKDCWYFMPTMMGYGRKGVPDIIGCCNGRFFAIEVKAPGKEGTLTKWQEQELSSIDRAGGVDVVADNVEKVIAIFKRA